MQHIKFIKKIVLGSLFALLGASTAMAQATAPVPQPAAQGTNQLELLVVAVLAVLAFVIWLLGQVLLLLGKQVNEKNKAAKILPLLLVGLLSTATFTTSAQDTAQAGVTKVAANYGGLSSGAFEILLAVLVIEVVIIGFMTALIKRFTAELIPKKAGIPAKAGKLGAWWARFDKKVLTRAIPVEREADVMLDHNYDGIRELDNPLPPWWKYGFYITIGVAIVYLLNYEVLGYGKNPTEEYNAEMAEAHAQQAIYESNNKDKIDEAHVPYADAAGLTKAKAIFTTTCFACHGKLGEGGAGPNLTDDYWLHKGSLNDIYQSIKHGYPDKGMQAWSAVYTPKDISLLASYVKSLHGTNPPNAKSPQGDLFTDGSSSPNGSATDSANNQPKAAPDSMHEATN